MNNNIVTMDLEKYDGIMEELRGLKTQVENLKDKIVLDADSFCIETDYDGEKHELLMDRKAIKIVTDIIGGYSIKHRYSKGLSVIGKYEIEVTKEEE